MAALEAPAVAALLVELGRRTALAGDNYFRAKAYQRAADTLSALVAVATRLSVMTHAISSLVAESAPRI